MFYLFNLFIMNPKKDKITKHLRIDIAFIFCFTIFVNLYPFSRAAGTFYQLSRGDAVIKVGFKFDLRLRNSFLGALSTIRR